MVTSLQLYRQEIYLRERPSPYEEPSLIAQAKEGDLQAKEAILAGSLRYVLAIATYYQRFLSHDECGDLIGIGNLTITELFERSLEKENPIGYLQGCAKRSIIYYCSKHSKNFVWELLDSDLLAMPSVPSPPPPWLYGAVEQLPKKQREVITRHFGLYGGRAESLHEISRSLSPNPHCSMAYPLFYRALRNLRSMLVQTSGQQERGPT